MKGLYLSLTRWFLALTFIFGTTSAFGLDVNSTLVALRLANTITGGFMPTSDPLFAQMVTKVAAGDVQGAAAIAANSAYFGGYLAKRLAFEMQNPALDPTAVTDSDATTYITAHFLGGTGFTPSISTLWSENATYLVNVGGTPTHAASLTAAQLAAVNWTTDLVSNSGQQAKSVDNTGASTTTLTTIPAMHVGGYATLSDRANDNSFAMYGALAGTNLRMIEGIWEISTGFSLLDVASTSAVPTNAPRFVPEDDPNFFHGQGQTACIACHGGGMSSIPHGYATVADIFNYDTTNGLSYIATPTTATMKSLASDPTKRATNATCNLVTNPTAVCNPDSTGVGTVQAWDLTQTWQSTGVLTKMGWTGDVTGQGLNKLGAAIGKAQIIYEFLTKRVINEVCPMGSFTQAQVTSIANAANPNASPAGTDDVRTIVSMVASNATCR